MSLVEFKDVYKRYQMGEVTINAVDGISFTVEEGEFAVVVGASGAGKTTVLNLLAAWTAPPKARFGCAAGISAAAATAN